MATYAATINNTFSLGNARMMDISFVATGTYTTTGDSITAATCGLDVITNFVPVLDTGAGAQTNGVGVLAYNSTANKLQIFNQQTAAAGSTMLELGSGTTITGLGFRALVIGF